MKLERATNIQEVANIETITECNGLRITEKITFTIKMWVVKCPTCKEDTVTSSWSSVVVCNKCQTLFASEVKQLYLPGID